MRSRLLRWLHCWHSGGLPALRLPSHWPRQPVSPGTDSKTSHSTSIYSSRQRRVQPTLSCLQQILLSHKFWSLIHFRFRTNRHEISCVHFPTEIIWLCVLTSFKSGFSKTKKKKLQYTEEQWRHFYCKSTSFSYLDFFNIQCWKLQKTHEIAFERFFSSQFTAKEECHTELLGSVGNEPCFCPVT